MKPDLSTASLNAGSQQGRVTVSAHDMGGGWVGGGLLSLRLPVGVSTKKPGWITQLYFHVAPEELCLLYRNT